MVSEDKRMITLELSGLFTTDWQNVKVIYNNSAENYEFTMNGSEFHVGFINNTYTKESEAVTAITVPAASFAVIYY